MHDFPTILSSLSWVISIIDGGIMILFFVGASTYKQGRLNQRQGMFVCLLIALIFGANAAARGLDGFMGGSVRYAVGRPDVVWPLVALEIARFFHVVFGLVFWVWVLLQFRRYRIDSSKANKPRG